MNKTSIGWVRNPDGSQGYTWNPITGCLNHDNGLCKGGGFPCYAYKLAHGRLKPLYLENEDIAPFEMINYRSQIEKKFNPFYPRFWEERLAEMTKRNDRLYYDGEKTEYPISPRGIFVCNMGDLFGVGVPEQWTEKVLDEIWGNKGYDRFYILTKQAQRLPEFSPFPDNCWVGVTATNSDMAFMAVGYLRLIEAKVKFISFEPLLKPVIRWVGDAEYLFKYVDWLIIGACTGTLPDMTLLGEKYSDLWLAGHDNKITAQPKIEWVREIVEAADKAGIPVFLKENLVPLIAGKGTPEGLFYKDCRLRQEMPEIK